LHANTTILRRTRQKTNVHTRHHHTPPPHTKNARSFSPPERFAPFQLAPGLAYNKALENAASAMEVAAVAAANSARLVLRHLDAAAAGAAATKCGGVGGGGVRLEAS
jgi:hypothetical protein